MTEQKEQLPRRSYLVDVRMQLSVALPMVGVLFLMSVFYVVSAASFSGSDWEPSSQGVQRLGFAVTGLFFVLALLVTLVVGVVTTQRIAGPARVIESAIRGLRQGDYARRLSLRKRDHLKSVAAELEALRDEMLEQEVARQAIHREMHEALALGDTERARELLQEADSREGERSTPHAA